MASTSGDQPFLDRTLSRRNTLSTKNPDKKHRSTGNQRCSVKSGSPEATIIPARANTKTKSIMVIRVQQAKLESYQEVMALRKKGF